MKKLFFSLSNNKKLTIEKRGSKLIINDESDSSIDLKSITRYLKRQPFYIEIDENKWLNRRTKEVVTLDKIIDNETLLDYYSEDSFINDKHRPIVPLQIYDQLQSDMIFLNYLR